MIEGFKDYTAPLDEEEEQFIEPTARLLELAIGPEKAICNKTLQKLTGFKDTGSGPRMRKIVRHIRISGIVKNVCANGKGDYIAQTDDDFHRYAKSLEGRIRADQSLLSVLTLQWSEKGRDDWGELWQ